MAYCSLVLLLVGLDRDVREIGHILIGFVGHRLQAWHNLVDEHIVVKLLNVQLNDACDTELDVGDAVVAGLDKSRNNHFTDVFSGENWHDS